MKMRKILSTLMVTAALFSLCVTPASAAEFSEPCEIKIEYHYVPILEDSAIGNPAAAQCVDDDLLSLTTTVTAYNDDSSVTEEYTSTNFLHILEGWTSKTRCVAKIRSITFAEADFVVTDGYGTDSQHASVSRP